MFVMRWNELLHCSNDSLLDLRIGLGGFLTDSLIHKRNRV
jgi:hypothetical protein